MIDKQKLAEIEKAINDTQTELAAIQQEKKAAVSNPERLVLAEKQERRTLERLEALKRTKTAATFMPPEPTDKEELLRDFKRYATEHAAKVQKVKNSIQAAEAERLAAIRGLQQAAEDCDTEKTVELSEKKAELESRLSHLREMLGRVSDLPAYPEGAANETWAEICKKKLPDWERTVLRVEMLAAEYKTACRDLLELHNTLKSVRDEIERMEKSDGYYYSSFPTVFTAGLNADCLMISKADCAWLTGIAHPLSGQAL